MLYAIDLAKKEIKSILGKFIKEDFEIEIPPENIKADFCVPFFKIAAKSHENPQILAEKILEKTNLGSSIFSKIERAGAYLNFTLNNQKYISDVFKDFSSNKDKFGSSNIGKGKTIIVDYSSPNIGKPFSIGHLRSTVIGQALKNIYQYLGYKVIGDNHLGDWGTQFGKLIAAYKKWGNEKKVNQSPIQELLSLYVKFHSLAEKDPSLNDYARLWFKKLEDQDQEAIDIWKLFKDLSLNDFHRIYDLLGIKFDYELGESFYIKNTDEIISTCEKKKIAKWVLALDENGKKSKNGEKVLAVDLKKYGIDTPLLLKKSDGTTLYATRDLAAIKYRTKKWNPDAILYVVGSEQKLYFKQLFKVAELIGFRTQFEHIDFGLIRLPEGKMSTRRGKIVFLEKVLDESTKKVADIINVRNMNKKEREEISQIVGIGAIKYSDLSQNRIHDIVFDWNKIINLKGNAGPYLQYQVVRIKSILKKAGRVNLASINSEKLAESPEISLVKKIARFPELINKSLENDQPYILTSYLFELAETFSLFYEKVSVLGASDAKLKNTRLYLCQMTKEVLEKGLSLLGIDVPEKM